MASDEGASRPFEYGTTWYEDGKLVGAREMLVALLEDRFGPLGETARRRLEDHDFDRLIALAVRLVDATSLKELGLED